jgi:hypothetical protein
MISVILALACGKQEEPAKVPRPLPKPQASSGKPEAAKPEPLAKELSQIETARLRIYDEPGMPIRAEYPDTMEVVGTGSGEGSGFIFSFKPQGTALDKATIHIFLPKGAATAADQEPFVTGPKGLMENNGWKKEDVTTETVKFPYGWVKKIINFSDPGNKGMVGKILLGETSGQAVQVVLYYPGDMDNDFLPNANLILKKLHFKNDKLPLRKSY